MSSLYKILLENDHRRSHQSKTSKTSITFNQHRRLHTNVKYTCDICKKSYPNLFFLKWHLEATHFRDTSKCKFCDKVLSTQELVINGLKSAETLFEVGFEIGNRTKRANRK
uniref:CSON008624 protein n=1 Tax=Culicoides sonorensis TaxID=179676 RepID=A0A336M2Y5_CULSO